jgi:hypothetical protein
MKKYDSFEKEKEDAKNQPHPDLKDNKDYFYRKLSQVQWINGSVTVEIQDKATESIFNPNLGVTEAIVNIKEHICVMFSYKKQLKNFIFVLSFHQSHRKDSKSPGFREELCCILNFFVNNGYAQKVMSDSQNFDESEKKWKKLFN